LQPPRASARPGFEDGLVSGFVYRQKIVCVVLVILAMMVGLFPQQTAAASRKSKELFFGATTRMDSAGLGSLRKQLLAIEEQCPRAEQKCRPVGELLNTLGGGMDSRGLPIHLIYLDGDGDVLVNRLLWKNKVTPFIHGARNIWVMVFSDRPMDLDVELTSLWQERRGLNRSLRDVFVSSGRRSKEEREATASADRLEMEPMAEGPAVANNLWLGRTRFYVDVESAYVITVQPIEEEAGEQVAFEQLEARFTNSASRSIDGGIGVGITFDTEDLVNNDLDGVETSLGKVSLYWLLNVYLRRPILIKPIVQGFGGRYRTSYALSFGFNLNIFDVKEVILGFNVGHLFGRHGIVVGANLMSPYDDPPPGTDNEAVKPFFAFNFNF
jgi:hypothetical protein